MRARPDPGLLPGRYRSAMDSSTDPEIIERYGRVADGFTRRLEAVEAGSWANPSPCPDWSARDVAAHVVDTHRRVLANVDDGPAAQLGPDDDVVEHWHAARKGIEAALADPDKASKAIAGRFAAGTFASLVGGLLCSDTLVHTWDLARATGQDDTLDPGAVDPATELLLPLDEALRQPGGFAPRIEPQPDADAQTRFLNFCGRQVPGRPGTVR